MYGLLNNTFISTHYTASNGNMFSKRENIWNKESRRNLRLYSGIYLEQMRETPENLSQGIRRCRQSSIHATPECMTASFTVW